MCGIFAAVSFKHSMTREQEAFLRAATITGQLRGEDGTGMIIHGNNGKVEVYKKAICGNDFLFSRQGRVANWKIGNSKCVIGHNRKTTSGGNDDDDCHPFAYDNVVGVHNGGFPHSVLSRLDTKSAVADVDSAKVLAAIDKADDPLSVLKKIHTGSYALMWIDKGEDTMCIARNDNRPMWCSNGDEGMYFASEPGMLFWLMSRYGLNNKHSKIYELDAHTLYRIPIDTPENIKKEKYEIDKPPHVPAIRGHNTNSTYHVTNPATYKYVSGPVSLARDFPALAFVSAVIEENLKIVSADYKAAGNAQIAVPRIDMVVTHVEPRVKNDKFLNMSGYMLDQTDGEPWLIPISMIAVKDDWYNMMEKFTKSTTDGALFTSRVRINNIRVAADGTVVLCCNLINVWDENSNVPLTPEVQDNMKIVQDSIPVPSSRLPAAQLTKMWEKLEAPITQH